MLDRKQQNPSRLVGGSLVSPGSPSHPGLLLGRVLPPQPLRLLILPSGVGRGGGGSFEGYLPPSQLQVF